jgi:hypothetical protein
MFEKWRFSSLLAHGNGCALRGIYILLQANQVSERKKFKQRLKTALLENG